MVINDPKLTGSTSYYDGCANEKGRKKINSVLTQIYAYIFHVFKRYHVLLKNEQTNIKTQRRNVTDSKNKGYIYIYLPFLGRISN